MNYLSFLKKILSALSMLERMSENTHPIKIKGCPKHMFACEQSQKTYWEQLARMVCDRERKKTGIVSYRSGYTAEMGEETTGTEGLYWGKEALVSAILKGQKIHHQLRYLKFSLIYYSRVLRYSENIFVGVLFSQRKDHAWIQSSCQQCTDWIRNAAVEIKM